jgi:hypothetical protein
MKIEYSLKQFFISVKELAKQMGKDYATVNVEMSTEGMVKFGAYIEDAGFVNGETPEITLEKLRDKGMPVPVSTTESDIKIEIENTIGEPESSMS